MLKNFLKAGVGGAGAQFINFLSLPIISRMYAPTDYAVWAIMIAATSVLGTVACLRYELAIVIPEDDEEASALFYVSLVLSGISAFVAVILVDHPDMGRIIIGSREPVDSLFLLSFPILVFFLGLNGVLQYWSVRNKEFLLNSVALIGCTVSTVTVQVSFALMFTASAVGLISGSLAGSLTYAMIIMGRMAYTGHIPVTGHMVFRKIPVAMRNYRLFPYYSTPFTLFGVLRDRGAVFILSAFLSEKIVGLYAFSYRILNFPVRLVTGAIRPVVFQKAASGGIRTIEGDLNLILKNIAIISLPCFVFYLYYPEQIFRVVFGSRWAEAGTIGIFLIWPSYTFLFCNWMDRILDILKRQKLAFFMEVVFSVLSLSALGVAFVLGLDLKKALMIQCAVLVAYNVVYIGMTYRCAGFSTKPLYNILTIMTIAGPAEWFFLKLAEYAAGMIRGAVVYVLTNVVVLLFVYRGYLFKKWNSR